MDVVPGAIEDAAFTVWAALMGLCVVEIEVLIRNLEWVEKAVRGSIRSCVQMAQQESVTSSNIKSERRGLLEVTVEWRLRKESVMKGREEKDVRFLSSATKAVTANSFTMKVRSASYSAALRVISTEKSVKSATGVRE